MKNCSRITSWVFIGLLVGMVFSAQLAYAWGLNAHIFITEKAIERAQDTAIKKLVLANEECFFIGLVEFCRKHVKPPKSR